MSPLVDTHAHLCDAQFDSDRPLALGRALERGVETIVEIAESPDGWEKARDFSESSLNQSRSSSPLLYWACGFHPHYADRPVGDHFGTMKKIISSPSCVALGEVGLDYAKSAASRESQIDLFRKTLEIAAEFSKPVVIHCREAQADMARILKSFYGGTSRRELSAGVIHCFSGDASFAEIAMDLGFYLGVDGPITYPSAKNLREVISKAPLEKIVLETDCPYLPPQGFRGKRNEPSYLRWIASAVADVFQKSAEEIAITTTENALKLFRLWKNQK